MDVIDVTKKYEGGRSNNWPIVKIMSITNELSSHFDDLINIKVTYNYSNGCNGDINVLINLVGYKLTPQIIHCYQQYLTWT